MNIVTIDFDIIMKPSIQLYNDLVGSNKKIDKIIKEYPSLEYCLSADLYIYEYLTRFLVSMFPRLRREQINFIKSHEEIIKLVEKDEPFHLLNIDHHHDLGYENVRPNTKIFRPGCGDWAKYLIDNKKILSYAWAHNNNSDFPSTSMMSYINEHYILYDFNLDRIPVQIDKLIICNSPQWIPNNIQPLFYTWESICEEWYNKEDIL